MRKITVHSVTMCERRMIAITPALIKIIPNLPPEACSSSSTDINIQLSVITELISDDMNQEVERSKAECSSQMIYPTDNTQNDLFITARGRLRAMGEPIVNECNSNSQFLNLKTIGF